MRIAVLASGGGSNLGSIFSHFDALGERGGGAVVLVASDRPGAGALGRAHARSVPTIVIADPADADSLDALLREHEIELVVLAGYLRFVPTEITRRFRGRIVNVHPTLLPAFGGAGMYGLRAHRAVLAAGVKITGASVHFVDEVYDRGALIAQWPVPVLPGDTAETLAARVLAVEHTLYPRAIEALSAGRITLDDQNVVHVAPGPSNDGANFALTAHGPSSIGTSIDAMLGNPT
jgi:formyltetrahydrofolate-dependent phosphoribosylglycinamide formyltransferase